MKDFLIIFLVIILFLLIFTLVKTIYTHKIIKKQYFKLQACNCLLNNNNNMLKNQEFFKILNAGDDPCSDTVELNFVNYIQKYNMFMEIKL